MGKTLPAMMSIFPSSLSVFDWSGPEFLTFYTVVFVLAVWWSISRRQKYLSSFSPAPGTKPKLEHPVEIAYLAGGGARSAEVAIVSLIEQGSISWESAKTSNKGRLKAIGPLNPDCHWLERSLYSEISLRGVAGMPLTSFAPIVTKRTLPLASHLAKLGLRPTGEDIAKKGSASVLPLIALFLVGALKVMIGLSREKPVGILILFLLITVFAMVVIGAGFSKTTPAGQGLLQGLQDTRKSPGDSGLIGIAVFGIAEASAYADYPQIDPAMMLEFQKLSNSGGSGCGGSGGFGDGCSASSGCGAGGCSGGGGGCGGCGS